MPVSRSRRGNAQRQRSQIAQYAVDCLGCGGDNRHAAIAEFVGGRTLPGRHLDVTGSFQFQQQRRRRHIHWTGPARCASPRGGKVVPVLVPVSRLSWFTEYGIKAFRVQQENESIFESHRGGSMIRWGHFAEAYLSRYVFPLNSDLDCVVTHSLKPVNGAYNERSTPDGN